MISLQLKNIAYEYLESEIDLDELQSRLAPNMLTLISDPQSADADLVAEIQLGIAEISNSIISEGQFRNELRKELEKHTNAFLRHSESSYTDTSSQNQQTIPLTRDVEVTQQNSEVQWSHAGT